MGWNAPKISFGQIISHIFPGVILGIELVILIDLWYQPVPILGNLFKLGWNSQALVLIILIFVGTILGIIIDALHHFLFTDFHWKLIFQKGWRKNPTGEYEISNLEQLEIYKNMIDEGLLYYYEGYYNIAFALLPSLIIVPLVLYRLGVRNFWIIALTLIPLLFTVIFLGIEGWSTRKEYEKETKIIQESFAKQNKKSKK